MRVLEEDADLLEDMAGAKWMLGVCWAASPDSVDGVFDDKAAQLWWIARWQGGVDGEAELVAGDN